jgi:hypothetical protein
MIEGKGGPDLTGVGGMEAGTVLFGEERFHYTTCKRHLHTRMS